MPWETDELFAGICEFIFLESTPTISILFDLNFQDSVKTMAVRVFACGQNWDSDKYSLLCWISLVVYRVWVAHDGAYFVWGQVMETVLEYFALAIFSKKLIVIRPPSEDYLYEAILVLSANQGMQCLPARILENLVHGWLRNRSEMTSGHIWMTVLSHNC